MAWDYNDMEFFDDNGNEITFEKALKIATGYHPEEVVEGIFRYYAERQGIMELVLDDVVTFAIDNDFDYATDLEDAMAMAENEGLNKWSDTANEKEIQNCLREIGMINLADEFSIDCDYWLWPRDR